MNQFGFSLIFLLSAVTLRAGIIAEGVWPEPEVWLSGGSPTLLGHVGHNQLVPPNPPLPATSGYLEVNSGSSLQAQYLYFINGSTGIFTGEGTTVDVGLALVGETTSNFLSNISILNGATLNVGVSGVRLAAGRTNISIIGEGSLLNTASVVGWSQEGSELAIDVKNQGRVIANTTNLGHNQIGGSGYIKLSEQASWEGANMTITRGAASIESGSTLTLAQTLTVQDSLSVTDSSLQVNYLLLNGGTTTFTNSTIVATGGINELRVGWEAGSTTTTLNINPGTSVTLTHMRVGENGNVNILLDVDPSIEGIGFMANLGTITFIANPNLAAGIYTPLQFSNGIIGDGAYNGVGGFWNDIDKTFTISGIQRGGLFNQSAAGVRLGFSDDQLIVAFNSNAGTGSFEAQQLDSLDLPGELLAAYQFLTDIDSEALLSFDINGPYSQDDFRFWYRSDIDPTWVAFNPTDLSYDGQWLNFTVAGFSSYAVTVVPEPSSMLLLVLGGSLIGWRLARKSARARC